MALLKFLLFNGIARLFLNIDFGGRENKAPDRLKAMMADVLYTSVLFIPFIFLTLVATRLIESAVVGHPVTTTTTLQDLVLAISMCAMGVTAFNKDFFNGQSIVNRAWGYQVVDAKTLGTPTKFKCMLRNITGPVFPFELPFVLLNHERRLGDYIAGTKLIKVQPSDPKLILAEIKSYKYGLDAILALAFPVALFVAWKMWAWIGS
jgi:hypothetical protein